MKIGSREDMNKFVQIRLNEQQQLGKKYYDISLADILKDYCDSNNLDSTNKIRGWFSNMFNSIKPEVDKLDFVVLDEVKSYYKKVRIFNDRSELTNSYYTWIPFFKEFAKKIVEFKDDHNKLWELIKDSYSGTSVSIPKLEEDDSMLDIDPFTVLGTLCRGYNEKNQRILATNIKRNFGLASEVPTDYLGVVYLVYPNCNFFQFEKDRSANDFTTLWECFEKAVNYTSYDDKIDFFYPIMDLGNKGINHCGNSIGKASLGLFSLNPDLFISIDKRLLEYLGKDDEYIAKVREKIGNSKFGNDDYLEFCKYIKENKLARGESFAELSYKAFIATKYRKENNDENDVKSALTLPLSEEDWLQLIDDNLLTNDDLVFLANFVEGKSFSDIAKENKDKVAWQTIMSYTRRLAEDIIKKTDIDMTPNKENEKSVPLFMIKDSLKSKSWKLRTELTKIINVRKIVADINLANLWDYEFDSFALSYDEWLDLYHNNVITKEDLIKLSGFKDGKTCSEVAKANNVNYQTYISLVNNIYNNVSKVREISIKSNSETAKKWPLVFVGQGTNDEDQGTYIWKLRKELVKLIETQNIKSYDVYTMQDFLSEVIMPLNIDDISNDYNNEEETNNILNLIKTNKNVIIEGAPGVGKTFIAKRLCYLLMNKKDNTRIEFVQFHQSYSYEDFIEGYRPTDSGFKLEKGIFYEFCTKARKDPDNDYFFIIDEINRGNISKILGELMFAIEKDKRGQNVKLAYSKTNFNVPKNVYIIGMMNTADRSLALIDYALRRRFVFYQMKVNLDNLCIKYDIVNGTKLKDFVDKVKLLNETIKEDVSLGEGFILGYSYFIKQDDEGKFIKIGEEDIPNVVNYEIKPMLREYWIDKEDFAKAKANELLGNNDNESSND